MHCMHVDRKAQIKKCIMRVNAGQQFYENKVNHWPHFSDKFFES